MLFVVRSVLVVPQVSELTFNGGEPGPPSAWALPPLESVTAPAVPLPESSAPDWTVTGPDPRVALAPSNWIPPPLIVVPPEKVFVDAVSVSVPEPILVNASELVLSAMAPPNVVRVFKEPTVTVAGWELELLLRKMPAEPLKEPRLMAVWP